MTPVDDLADWLTQIWDADTKRFGGHEEDCADWLQGPCDCINGEMLARIAADRQILALHKPSGGECRTCCGEPYLEEYWDGETETTEWKRAELAWPCETARLLAQPFADRPGFEEAWRVTP